MCKTTGKEYHLKSFEDFMALSIEQFDRMVEDFKQCRRYYETMQQAPELLPKIPGVSPNGVSLPVFFNWLDDGAVGGNTIIYVEGKDGNKQAAVSLRFDDSAQPANVQQYGGVRWKWEFTTNAMV